MIGQLVVVSVAVKESGLGKPKSSFFATKSFSFCKLLFSRKMDVSKNRGTPKWMVKIMENPTRMDDLGIPLFLETPR